MKTGNFLGITGKQKLFSGVTTYRMMCPKLSEVPIQKRQASERSNMESQLVQLLSNKLVFLTRLSDSLISGTSLLPCISGCVQITLTCYKLKHIPL